jgi:phosphoglycolate phosphatase-like HAD superfamily hydrolase
VTAPEWIRVLRPGASGRLGHVRHALFDFDGTLSVLRQGWEVVMTGLMLESIGGDRPVPPSIQQEVRDYIDASTGVLTIRQMEWLAAAVERHGLAGAPRRAAEYKAAYLARLMVAVNKKVERLLGGDAQADDYLMAGARELLAGLAEREVHLHLASGSDHDQVVNEARALGLLPYFRGAVYGALDEDESHSKELVIQRILDEHHLAGDNLVVIGDGPVELKEGIQRGAITVGVCSDEVARHGWHEHKARRLAAAGADLLVADFSHAQDLLAILFAESPRELAQRAGEPGQEGLW